MTPETVKDRIGMIALLALLVAWFTATVWCFGNGYWPVGIALVVAGVIASDNESGGDCDPCMGE